MKPYPTNKPRLDLSELPIGARCKTRCGVVVCKVYCKYLREAGLVYFDMTKTDYDKFQNCGIPHGSTDIAWAPDGTKLSPALWLANMDIVEIL